jgi:hypothetical protein
MKKYLRLFRPKMQTLLIVMLTISSALFAGENNESNFVIITGQIINTEYGNPLTDYPVFIKSETVAYSSNYYFKQLYTDDDGFFYDTISTQLTYGSFEVYTYDHEANKRSQILHFRFLDDYDHKNVFLVNFFIYMPLQTPVLQAKFKYVKKTGGDKLRFKFIDQTETENVLSWHWEFGDGTTSDLKDPDHTYTDFGMYRVTLRIVAEINGSEVISDISQFVYIPQISYYHLGGHCYNGQFPIHKGQAILYKIDDDNVMIPFDTTTLNDTLGQYYFYQIPEGNYCVRTQPDKESEDYGLLIPTYYGDTEFWKQAEIIKLDHTDYTYHIHLVKSNGTPTGEGKIAGKIVFTYTGKDLTKYNSVGVSVYLLDALNRPLTYQYTDENSSFSFNNLATGTYWIYPEIAGFDLAKESIKLTELIPVVQDIKIEINGDAVYLIFPDSEDLKDNFVGQPYPNPASNQFSFEINTRNNKTLNLYITDLQGRVVISKSLNLENGLNKNTIETSGLMPGLYVLKLEADGIQKERKILINR